MLVETTVIENVYRVQYGTSLRHLQGADGGTGL